MDNRSVDYVTWRWPPAVAPRSALSLTYCAWTEPLRKLVAPRRQRVARMITIRNPHTAGQRGRGAEPATLTFVNDPCDFATAGSSSVLGVQSVPEAGEAAPSEQRGSTMASVRSPGARRQLSRKAHGLAPLIRAPLSIRGSVRQTQHPFRYVSDS